MATLELSDGENDRLSNRGDRETRDSDNDVGGFRSDEAEEDRVDGNDAEWQPSGRKVDPGTSRRVIRNPQPKLNAERIQGAKGIQTIENYFEGFKFHGKGYEKIDLDRVMKRLEHWAHRIFPKYQFDDFIEKMEILGTKKNVHVILKKYRLGLLLPETNITEGEEENSRDRDEEQMATEDAPIDEFDRLIAEQIEKQRRATNEQQQASQPRTSQAKTSGNVLGSASTSKPSELSDEVKARIEANKKLAIERRKAKLEAARLEEETKKRKLEESVADNQVQGLNSVNNNETNSFAREDIGYKIIEAEVYTLPNHENVENVIDSLDNDTDIDTELAVSELPENSDQMES